VSTSAGGGVGGGGVGDVEDDPQAAARMQATATAE
jgi:hypothetical protein